MGILQIIREAYQTVPFLFFFFFLLFTELFIILGIIIFILFAISIGRSLWYKFTKQYIKKTEEEKTPNNNEKATKHRRVKAIDTFRGYKHFIYAHKKKKHIKGIYSYLE